MKCASLGFILIDKVTIKKCHVEKIDIRKRQQKNRHSTILVNVENLYARPILTLDSTNKANIFFKNIQCKKQFSLVIFLTLNNVLKAFTYMFTHVREFLWTRKLVEN